MKKGKAGLGITLTAVLLAIMIAVGCVVNTYSEQISYWWSGTFTEPMTRAAYTADETLENGRAVSIEQASEGVVLLKNDNGALPLQANERSVSLVGCGSHNPVYCGAGSVSWNTTGDRSDFYDAFTYYEFSINEGLREYYTKNFGDCDTKEGQSEMIGGDFTIYAVMEQIDRIMIRRRKIERFIDSVKGLPELITEFDESLWASLVDSMTVYAKDRIVFQLTCGVEIES